MQNKTWNKIRHTFIDVFEPLLMSLESSDYNHSISLSHLVFGLNYKLENRDTTSLYYLTKNLNPKNEPEF